MDVVIDEIEEEHDLVALITETGLLMVVLVNVKKPMFDTKK